MLLLYGFAVWCQAMDLIPAGTKFTGSGISFEELERISLEQPEIVFGGRQEASCLVSTASPGGYSGSGMLCFVNQAYFAFSNLTFIAGGLSETFDGPETCMPVMISEDLARRLFFTWDCIGSEISINGQLFTVTGIYKEEQGLLHRISSNGEDILYTPYHTVAADTEAGCILIRPIEGGRIREDTIHTLNASLGEKLQYYVSWDLSEARERLSQLAHFYMFLLGCIAAIFLARGFAAALRKFIAWWRETDHGYGDVPWYRVLSKLIPPILCAAAFVAILLLVRFPLIIPSYFFPEGNRIVQLEHYVQIFVDGFVNRNIAAYSYLESVYYYGIWGVNIFSILTLLMFASFIAIFYRTIIETFS